MVEEIYTTHGLSDTDLQLRRDVTHHIQAFIHQHLPGKAGRVRVGQHLPGMVGWVGVRFGLHWLGRELMMDNRMTDHFENQVCV